MLRVRWSKLLSPVVLALLLCLFSECFAETVVIPMQYRPAVEALQRMETGMEVTPTLLKDHADIEIIPRIS